MSDTKPTPLGTGRRLLQAAAVLFLLWLVISLIVGSRPRLQDRFQLVPLDMTGVETKSAGASAGPSVPQTQAMFDEQGFPVSRPQSPAESPEYLAGYEQIMAHLQSASGSASPRDILRSFESRFGRYWKDPQSAAFFDASQAMSQKLTGTADRNRRLVQSLSRFLTSDAGRAVSATLKENLVKAVDSPAREALGAAFTAWKSGDLERAWQLMKQAESLDPGSVFIQIIAHQGMAFLNMEKHGPLEETMRQYRDLAEEGHKYISSFRPALEKAGFDPVKLYGRDPFDARGLPSSEQFEKAMNQSRYVQFERDYYSRHLRGPARAVKDLQPEAFEYLKKRRRGGQR